MQVAATRALHAWARGKTRQRPFSASPTADNHMRALIGVASFLAAKYLSPCRFDLTSFCNGSPRPLPICNPNTSCVAPRARLTSVVEKSNRDASERANGARRAAWGHTDRG